MSYIKVTKLPFILSELGYISCNLHFIMKMKCFMFSQFSPHVFWPKSKICTTIRPLGSKATRLRDSVKSQHFFVVLFARLFSLTLKKRTKWSLITIMIITAVRKKFHFNFNATCFFVPTSNYFVAGQNPRFTSKWLTKKMKWKTIEYEWMTTRTLDGVVLIGRPNGEFVITLIFSGMPITT